MILYIKNADFSKSNIGKMTLPNTNINIGEGTSKPLLFKYATIGAGEFLGVSFIEKQNPSCFGVIRRATKNTENGHYLYSYQTSEGKTINIPKKPKNISMAIWINMSSVQNINFAIQLVPQVYNNGWKGNPSSGNPNPMSYTKEQLLNIEIGDERSTTKTNSDYFNYQIKSKCIAKETVNEEEWVCLGFVFSNISYIDGSFDESYPLRFAITEAGTLSIGDYFEIANLQVVLSDNYIDPKKDYSSL